MPNYLIKNKNSVLNKRLTSFAELNYNYSVRFYFAAGVSLLPP